MTPQQLFIRYTPLARYWRGEEHYVALEGLWRAANKCDASNTGFRTYAFICMRGAVFDRRRAEAGVPRRSHKAGRTIERYGDMDWMNHDTPTPEELLLEKERVVLTNRAVAHTFGNEGALLRASLLELEHQHIARRLGISKSWASRVNRRAETKLARQLKELRT